MKNTLKMFAFASVCASILLGGCQAQHTRNRHEESEPDVTLKLGTLAITSTKIDLRCEITNGTSEDIWVCETPGDAPDKDDSRHGAATMLVDTDDRTLIVGRRIGIFRDREIWCLRGAFYRRLPVGQSCPVVLRIPLPMPDYDAQEAGLVRRFGPVVDRLTRASFEIGYFTEKDLDSLRIGSNSIHKIVKNKRGDRIDARDSSEGELCRAERIARIVVDGIQLPYKEWLTSDTPAGK